MNTDVSWSADTTEAWARVLRMQTKLHQWATTDSGRRFDDVFNLVYDPAFLVAAWNRIQGNKGGRTAGVDGIAPRSITPDRVSGMLAELRESVKRGGFVPERAHEKSIPKANGKVRKLGISTVADRIVQASLKLVLEPIFEADVVPSSYGFRARRRAQNAIAEIHFYASRGYVQVFEADITACFDEIDHDALMQRVGGRIVDKRVLCLIRGTHEDAEALRDETAAVLAPMGLRLSVEKTKVTHIDTGLDFLGWRIRGRRIRGHGGKTAIYTYPSKKSLTSIRDKVRLLTRRASH